MTTRHPLARTVFVLALALCLVLPAAASTNSPWINVNFDRSDSPASTNLVGPAGGAGAVWNILSTNSGYVGTTTNSSLLDYAGMASPVTLTCYADSLWFWSHNPQLAMFRAARSTFFPSTPFDLSFDGLNPAKRYDIYIGAYYGSNNEHGKGRFWTANTTAGATTNYYDNGGTDGNDDTWVEGTNYVCFLDVEPNANSNVTITCRGYEEGSDTNRVQVSGIQIVDTSKAHMSSFGISGMPAEINDATTNITWTVPYGTDVTTLGPAYTLSRGATCNIPPGTIRDFTTPVTYTVTSSDSGSVRTYIVAVVVTPASAAKEMLLFGPGATINGSLISWRVPYGSDLTALAPACIVSRFATCDPPSGATNNFSSPVTYTVTAQDLSTKQYVVIVSVLPRPWINVNFDAVPQSDLVGPAGGSGATWNAALASPCTRSNLLDAAGNTSVVGFTCTANGLDAWPYPPQFAMLRSAARSFSWSDPYKLVINGLDTRKQYDLCIAAYYPNENGCKGQYVTTNITAGAVTNFIDNGGPNGNDDVWIAGTNYIRFVDLVPTAGSNITIDIVGTNGCRAMLSGFQLMDVTLRQIDITNEPLMVEYPVSSGAVAGTNDIRIVGTMWASNAANGTCVEYAASLSWTTPALPLVVGINIITVYGTNVEGIVASDSVLITRLMLPSPFCDITNTASTVRGETASFAVAGTNNAAAVGGMWVSNAAVGGASSGFPAAPSWTAPALSLAFGDNTIVVYATNMLGVLRSDSVVITRAGTGTPFVNVTNVTMTVSNSVASMPVAGTNNLHVVGTMWCINTTIGGTPAPFAASLNWVTPAVSLNVGLNQIYVYGTNALGEEAFDVVFITRETAAVGTPFVDITNADRVVDYQTTTCTIAGTNNAHVVGSLTWTNHLTGASGSLATYDVGFTISDVPLGVGSNVIVVIGTNLLGVVAADTTTVVRLSAPQVLSVQPSMLDFGTNGTYLTLLFSNLGTGGVDFTIAPSAAWLNASPASGSVSTQSITVGVSVNRAGLVDNFYSALLTVMPSVGGDMVVTCRMAVAGNSVLAHPGGPYVTDQGSPVTLDGSASLGVGLRYRWESGDFISSLSTDNVRYVYAAYVPGTNDVFLTVRDSYNQSNTRFTNLIVRNVAPSMDIGGPYTGAVGRAMNFRATISDPGTNDTVEIRWDFGTGWSAWMPASATNTPFSFASGGNYVVQAETRDNYGGVGSDSATAFIDVPNMPPTARATLGSPGVVLSNFAGMHMGFILDGTGSTDDRTNVAGLYFDWREDVRNPAKPLLTEAQKRMVVLTNSITFPLPGMYKYHLVVNDGEYNSASATVQINVPGIHGLVKAEGTMALLPVWGVMVVATNEATGAADWCLSDTEGRFVLDTGAGNSRMLVLSRGDQQTVRNVHVDADGVTWREPEGMLAFPARPCGLSAIVNTGYVGGAWLGLPGASGRIVVGDTVAYSGASDLQGQMAFGGIPELFPRTATVNYQVLYQKSGYESDVLSLQADPTVVAQHTPQLDTSGGYVVRGIVLGTNNLPAGGIEVDFGPAFTPAVSAQDGTFAASNVMRGEYFVELRGNDYDTTYATVVVPQGSPDYLLPQPLRIRGGRFSVYGEIFNGENGMPIPAATVTVVETGLRKMYPRMATTNAAGTTTRTGYYDLPVVKGTRTLQIEAPGYEGTTIVVNAGTHVQQPVQLVPVAEPVGAGSLFVIGYWLFVWRREGR